MGRVVLLISLLLVPFFVSCDSNPPVVVENKTDNVIVTPVVKDGWPNIKEFSVSSENIRPGENITLTWNVGGADYVSIDQGLGIQRPEGSIGISPVKTTKYTITASSKTGSTQAWLTVSVIPLSNIMPDLVVTGVTQISGLLYYTIKNVGSVDAGHSYTYVYDSTGARRDTSWVESLKAGETRTLPFSNFDFHGEAITVCADAENEIAEANDDNNCFKGFGIMVPDYYFAQNASRMTWISGEGKVNLSTSAGSNDGTVQKLAAVQAEDGNNYTNVLKIVPPVHSRGWIQGQFGEYQELWQQGGSVTTIEIPGGAHFKAKLGFESAVSKCRPVTCYFGVADSAGNVEWWPGMEISYDGKLSTMDLDLTAYSGKKYMYVLKVENGDYPQTCGVLWIDAKVGQ